MLEDYAPVAIGGVGGSGTRLVAKIVTASGFFLGSDLNKAGDNLWYSLLFVRKDLLDEPRETLATRLELFVNAMVEGRGVSRSDRALLSALADAAVPHGPMEDVHWLKMRADRLLDAATAGSSGGARRWGWKEPNTHILLDRLAELLPQMRYVHVARNGLDMAFNANQHQLRFWGKIVFGLPDQRIDPYHALKYWCHVHRRVLRIGAQMGDRFLLLKYDDICADPRSSLSTLCRFLGVDVDGRTFDTLVELVEPAASIGCSKAHALEDFDPQDVDYVASQGFAVR